MVVEKHSEDGNVTLLRVHRKKPFFVDVWRSGKSIFTVTDKTIFTEAGVLGDCLSIVSEDWLYNGVIQVTVIDLNRSGEQMYLNPKSVPYKVLKPQEVPQSIRSRVMSYITSFALQGFDYFLYEGLFQFNAIRLSSTKIPGYRTGWWE